MVQPHDMFDAASKSMTVLHPVPRLFWIRNSHVFDSFVATSQRKTATHTQKKNKNKKTQQILKLMI